MKASTVIKSIPALAVVWGLSVQTISAVAPDIHDDPTSETYLKIRNLEREFSEFTKLPSVRFQADGLVARIFSENAVASCGVQALFVPNVVSNITAHDYDSAQSIVTAKICNNLVTGDITFNPNTLETLSRL